MSKKLDIQNIDDLRQFGIDVLEKLSNQKISIEEAGVTGKLCENIVSTLKVQLEYAKMLGQEPELKFLEKCTLPRGRVIDEGKKLLDSKGIKQLEKKR